jgi:hypothetical protein
MDKQLTEWFGIKAADNIMEEAHFGLVNGRLTGGVNYRSLLTLNGLWAPPYVSSDFFLRLRLNGEKVPVGDYQWLPWEIKQQGAISGLTVTGEIVLVADRRAALCVLTLANPSSAPRQIKLQWEITGALDYADVWEFQRPKSQSKTENQTDGEVLVRRQGEAAIALASDIPGLAWFDGGSLWETQITLAAGETRTYYLALAMGKKTQAEKDSRELIADPEKFIAASRAEYARRVEDLFAKLPTLEASDPRLVKLYNRSLLHLLTNRWQAPEFVLQPYYSTGSVKGGCVCNYLWDFGEVWKILPLYDPAAAKSHIRQFLKIDITQHFSFNPMDGRALGPWYPANQEKIIGLTYYYVLQSGDRDFLAETVGDKTVLQWMIANALQGDDLNKPVALQDYGPAGDHLELRREYQYNHVMPDLNGRRYANYLLAAGLCDLAGAPASYLRERAEELKALLPSLWDNQARWFHFLGEQGPELRYTVQMFKLIGSGVLSKAMEAGLLSHLNEAEFLSTYGLHSMAKTDPAYDQVDIDNGGGGCYTGFPAQIMEKLYQAGYTETAEDILSRLLWWGEKMPYWGDSLVANYLDYRHDTPLQCALTGASVAESLIFGMFGVEITREGEIVINPRPPKFSPAIALKGLRWRGQVFDIQAEGKEFHVRQDDKVLSSPIGSPLTFPLK